MEELMELLKKLPPGSENVIHNLKLIVTNNYAFLKRHKLTKKDYKILFLGDILKRQQEFKLELFKINDEIREEYESTKGKKPPYPIIMLEEFFEYFGEMDREGKFLRFENKRLYPTWETKMRLAYWYRRSKYSK